ncbi:hypothetical protein ACIO3O_17430 [Streptomyces sp. NPDC087440]|uniref:hypothetical protein n=1 Tax=Streptomyces sp. NPDC087440 TaxID=3365790 RepID=UPI0037F37B0D
MDRIVRGFWGPREETVAELAPKWKATLDLLAELLPAAFASQGESWMRIADNGPAVEFPTDGPAVEAALRAELEKDGWSDQTGIAPSLMRRGEHSWQIEVSGRTGGVSEFLTQMVLIKMTSPDDAAVPETDLMARLSELWDPDYGDVSDPDTRKVFRERGGQVQPSVGRVGYLSSARAALVPDDLKAVSTVLTSGGVLLDIAAPGDHETALAAHLRLRESGALQPLPKPMDRSKL